MAERGEPHIRLLHTEDRLSPVEQADERRLIRIIYSAAGFPTGVSETISRRVPATIAAVIAWR